MKQRLGELLVARGWLTPPELNRALRAQRRVGGRLGTCLLEACAITEGRLERALSELHRAPSAGYYDLANITAEVLEELPASLARRHHAVPFNATKSSVDIAFLNPRDLAAQDEVAFAIGRRIRAHSASELRIAEALYKHYAKSPPARLGVLIDRVNARFAPSGDLGESRSAESLELAAGGPPSSAPISRPGSQTSRAISPPPPLPPPPTLPPRTIQLTTTERSRLNLGSTEPSPSVEGRIEGALMRGAERLGTVRSRDDVGAVLLDILEPVADRIALFKIKKDRVRGWTASLTDLDREAFEEFDLDLEKPSAFRTLRDGIPFHLGALPGHPKLAACWHGRLPSSNLIVPIRMRRRLVAAIYAADSSGVSLGVNPATFERLAEQTARALKRCIVLKKQAASGP